MAHERSVSLAKSELLDFCGKNDEKIRMLEKTLGTKLILRGTDIKIVGEQPKVEHAVQVIGELLQAQPNPASSLPNSFVRDSRVRDASTRTPATPPQVAPSMIRRRNRSAICLARASRCRFEIAN